MSARIVFDLDGTLIDSAPDIQGIANALLESCDAAPISLEETHGFIGRGVEVFVQKMRAARGIPDSEQVRLVSDFAARYDDAVTLTVPYPGVEAALAALGARHRLGICTNKLHRATLSVLRHLGLDRHFGTIWGGDNPLARKPDPAPLQAAFAELGEGPMIYVGDSEVDAETARRAGVPFFLFTEGYRHSSLEEIPHDVAFSDFAGLAELVEDHLATGRGRGRAGS